jgi:hypothetical protein
MAKSTPEKIVPFVSIDLDEHEARIEKLTTNETGKTGQAGLRISGRKKGGGPAGPLTITEEQLIELLHKASLGGVLSSNFIAKLREKNEI